jgi:hypothetical protein
MVERSAKLALALEFDAVFVVVVGDAGAVFESEPGIPPASLAELRSSLEASDRVFGPFSLVSKYSVVVSV